MLTRKQTKATRNELKINFERLNYTKEKVARDLKITERKLEVVLDMKSSNPSHVWMLRKYLEDMIIFEGKEMYPFSKLANKNINIWYDYETPWRK